MKQKKMAAVMLVLVLLFAVGTSVCAETKVNYKNFLKIKIGSTYADVVKILGEGNNLGTDSEVGVEIITYSWTDGYKSIGITTENGKVASKSQDWLVNSYSNVTVAKYNKVKKGMSYYKVKKILGAGVFSSQAKIDGKISSRYQWRNKNGAIVSCFFMSGKLTSKEQYRL